MIRIFFTKNNYVLFPPHIHCLNPACFSSEGYLGFKLPGEKRPKLKSLLLTWNLFVVSLVGILTAHYNARKIMVSSFLTNLPHLSRQRFGKLKEIPLSQFILAILPYSAYLILFSSNKAIRHITHLDEISEPNFIILSKIEHGLFFCYPHRVLSSFANPIFDIVAGVPYLIHFPLPFVFALYLAASEKRSGALMPFVWCLGWVHFVAVSLQIIFPTAPPWFVDSAVIDQHKVVVYTSPVEGGFSRVDQMLGIGLFHYLYSTSPLVFGAFPSLHVAMPMVIFLNHSWFGKKFGAFHVLLITLSALYIHHHYLVDALGGILLSCIVRLSILKIWSPFPELKTTDVPTQERDEIV